MPTLPDHSSHNRRIQINQAGSWASMFRFTENAGNQRDLAHILEAAEVLACWDGGARLRVIDGEGKVLRYWSMQDGWRDTGARA